MKRRLWSFPPKITYTNYLKLYPHLTCFRGWFTFKRLWSGRLWFIHVKHHEICLDFRYNWLADMADIGGNK